MPPRTVKRGSAAAGTKRTPRATRASQKVQNQPEVSEERAIPEDLEPVAVPVVELNEEMEQAVEEKPVVSNNIESEPELNNFSETEPELKRERRVEENSAPIALGSSKKEDEVKESGDEYEKDERLDLDDNEPEYEPEEYGGMDYDEKEIEQDGVQEDGDEVDEDPEEENIGEEEGEEANMGDEELEDIHEELDGEEGDEHAVEEEKHAEEKEHHDVVKERRKRKEFEVFVGGLDKDATENDLRKVFSEVGEITEVRLMMNPQTKKNKGFAFLRFATVEQARRAVTDLKNPVVNGRQCGVTQSQDSDTLFLGNICKTWTKEALKEKLKHFGIDTVEDLTLVEDSNNDGMNRGFAFLEFSSRSDAMDAYKRLQKRDAMFGVDRPAKVSFADSFIDPGDEIMSQVKTVFVDGLPTSWDEDRVRDTVKKYGEVEKIELARNMPSAKRKDFGFVTFQTHDAAVTCAKSINNTELGEGDNKVKVRARLSRPLQRPRGKYATHGDSRANYTAGRGVRSSWGRPPPPRSFGGRGGRGMGSRLPPLPIKRQGGFRDRRPVMAVPPRTRHLPPPSRPYERRAPVPSYPKIPSKRDYARREELPPRSRAHVEYGSRVVQERRPSYREEYSPRMSGYPDLPRSASRTTTRRTYVDDGYDQRFERPPPSYREGRVRNYEPISGSKRPYTALDDVPPRYADTSIRPSRARLDYELGASSSQYGDAYNDRVGRSNAGYTSSRNPAPSQDSHGVYSSRQSSSYGGGSYGSSEVGGMYSSSYSGDYISRGTDVSGSSYSSLYSNRGVGGSSYMGSGGGSGSYY